MQFGILDIVVFVGFIGSVISIGILMSRQEKDSESYFLAGRGLSWWLIGFSLIAANISTEQFVGMSGSAADYLGLAIASYEWMAAITLVVVAFVFLPMFLKSGIYTIPEFLEYRYNRLSRTIMSLATMIIYVGVTISAVIYSGAVVVDTLFSGAMVFGIPVNIATASWAIGLLAAAYVAFGGLKACAWADLLQGSALIVGGAVVVVLAMKALGSATPADIGLAPELADAGAIEKFRSLNDAKLHMVLPKSDLNIPWTALVLGLWIPNFYYWGLNQYITQRTLGAKSLGEGQKGIVFAAGLKLIIPFIIVVPGIIAFNLYKGDMSAEATKDNSATLAVFEKSQADPAAANVVFEFDEHFAKLHGENAQAILAYNSSVAGIAVSEGDNPAVQNAVIVNGVKESNKGKETGLVEIHGTKMTGYKFDSAFALLIGKLIPRGLRGFMLAAILGAVMSSLASMLNAASTIFTMDLYREYLNKNASQKTLVVVGRVCVVVFVVIGCLVSPVLANPKFGGIFKFIQEFQGFISPGILAVFVFGLLAKKAPPICGVVGLLLNPVIYFVLMKLLPSMAFLDRMAISFFCLMGLMGIITMLKPLDEPRTLPTGTKMDLEPSSLARVCGIIVVIATIGLYWFFW